MHYHEWYEIYWKDRDGTTGSFAYDSLASAENILSQIKRNYPQYLSITDAFLFRKTSLQVSAFSRDDNG